MKKNKPVLIIICMLALCLLLTSCVNSPQSEIAETADIVSEQIRVSEESAPDNRDGSGLYEWTVGNGYVLKTRTNIMDYIRGNSWRMSDMAEDLGFGDWEAQKKLDVPTGFKRIRDEREVTIRYDESNTEKGKTIRNLVVFTSDYNSMTVLYGSFEPSAFYKCNGYDKTWISFDLIVCFAYACEHYVDGEIMPFEGSPLPTSGSQTFLLGE